MTTLSVEQLESGYGEVQILWGASLKLREGQLTSLLGSNGAGKTTLLRAVIGLLPVWKGAVKLDDRAISRMSAHEKAENGLVLVPERRQQLAGTLSGGEQQMLAIARGLMAKPKILMFDEPSLGLSPLLVMNLFEIIRTLKREGLTMLLVEQNVQMSLAVSDYAYVMSRGRIEIEGPAREVRGMETVRKAYLGL